MKRSLRGHGRRVPLTSIGLVVVALSLLPAAVSADWSQARRVSSERGSRLDSLHQLAAGAGAFHLVHPRIDAVGKRDRVVYQRSRDGGVTWGKERTLHTGTSQQPNVVPNLAVASRGTTVAIAWRAKGGDGTTLYVRTSANRGFTFGERVTVASSRAGLGVPAITVGDDVIAVAFTDRRNGRVKVARSRDDGASFKKPVTLASTKLSIDCRRNVPDGLVSIAASGKRLHVAWSHAASRRCMASRINIRSSDDRGRTWDRRRTVTTTRSYGWPELDARGKTVLATVQLPGGDLLVARSSQHGRAWSERRIKAGKGHLLSAGDVVLLPKKGARVTYVDERVSKGRLLTTKVVTRRSGTDGRRFGRAEVVMDRAKRLRIAPNIATTRDDVAIALQSGGFDGSPRNIYVASER